MATYALTVSTNDLGLGVLSGARVVVERRRTQISDIFSGQALTKNTSATNTSGIAVMFLSPDDSSVYHELKIFDLAGIPVYSVMFTMPPQAVALTDLPVGDIISESAQQAVTASIIATDNAALTAADAAATAADRVQTGLDVIATGENATAAAASEINAALSESNALTYKTASEAARDAAIIGAGVYVDEPSGRAAVADGQAFKVQGSGNVAAYEYRRTNSTTSVLIASYPSSTVIDKPIQTGKYNGWPDPFFRRFDLTNQVFLGRDRWWWNGGGAGAFAGWSLVDNPIFDGKALRRADGYNSSSFSGPSVWLDEIGAAVGDYITVYVLIVGTSNPVYSAWRFTDSTEATIQTTGSMLDAVGVNNITPSATPKWLRASVQVPSGAARFNFYPYNLSGSVGFDVVAVWAHKGLSTDVPTWPTQQDELYYRLRDADLTTQTTINTQQTAKLDYMMFSTGVVTSASSTTNLAVTGAAIDTTYSNVFTGWGERYTPASISFNAVKVKKLGRNIAATTVKWRTLNIVVRTGTNSHLTGATVVAVGSTTVSPNSDTLTDITVLLKDPTTGAVKTLTDADFTNSEYFIGVYARDAAGVGAGMSLHLATQANTLGQSYYVTSGDPLTATWATNTGNHRVGVDHLLLTTPVEGVSYEPSSALLAQISEVVTPAIVPTVLVMPPTIYGVQGRECNVYFDNLYVDDSSVYLQDVTNTAANGAQQRERWTWIPVGAQTTGTLSVSACDKKSGEILVIATANQRAAASTAGSGTTKIINTIGDSLINAGTITQTVIDIASTDVMSVTMIGTKGSGVNKHEGRGGWSINDYSTVGRTFYSFTVSGVTTSPAINSTEYTNNGSTFKVQELALTAGSGTIICERTAGTNAPSASGTLTKSSGSGDATISFSASSTVSGNPFWISGALNYSQYLVNNSLATPDWVVIHLGINDAFGYTTDEAVIAAATAAFVNLDLLITSIKAAGAGVKVGLMIPTPPAGQDAFAANYGVGQTSWRYKRNIMLWAKTLIEKYTGQEANRIYLVPTNTALDVVNGYPLATSAPVNSRSSVMVQRQNNGVHPDTSGYQQIGDALWAFLKCNA